MITYKKFIVPVTFLAVLLLLIGYFLPLFQGKTLQQSDVLGWRGMVQEMKQFEEETGEHTEWTGSLFSGMPTATISGDDTSNWVSYILKLIDWIPRAVWVLWLTFAGFYFLLRTFHVSHWLSTIGAMAYMFSSYFFIITAVGHNTKIHAIAYIAFVLLGIVLTYRKKYILGGTIFALSLSLHIYANHPQVTYYLLLLVLLYGLFQLFDFLKNRDLQTFLKASFVLVLGAILALGSNAENLYKVYDYSKVSIRGAQTLEENTKKDGVDLAYATEWSYGKGETLTLLIPNIKGGASNGRALDSDSESYAVLEKMQVQNPDRVLESLPVYWGNQLFTEGGVYVGAIVFFFFFLGVFLLKSPLKWWLLIATILSVFLAWGRNFMVFYEFFYNYFPFFSKFRNPSTILILVEFAMPFLGFVALSKILEKPINEKLVKQIVWIGGILIGVSLLLWIIPSLAGNFKGVRDGQLPETLQYALSEDRRNLLKADALRSAFFILSAVLILIFYAKGKLKRYTLYLLLGVLMLTDMWSVNRRFLNDDNFISKRKQSIMPYMADKKILADTDLSYRVLDITESPFNSSRASYFHKSIGGYNAAKMRRYQDLIEYQLQTDIQQLVEGLKQEKQPDSLLLGLPVLRMLNMKYLIYHPQADPLRFETGLKNAWFVKDVKIANSAKEELELLGKTDVEKTAILPNEHKANSTLSFGEGNIQMVTYKPNSLSYEVQTDTGGLVIFSEIYHPDWKIKIAGKEIAKERVNYTLIGAELPKGSYRLDLEFKPTHYFVWKIVGIISSIILFLLLSYSLYSSVSQIKREK